MANLLSDGVWGHLGPWGQFGKAVIVTVALVLSMALAARAQAGTVEAGPQQLDDTISLAEMIHTHPGLHIVYVHGIRATGPGIAQPLVSLLERKLGFKLDGPPVDRPIELPGPPNATMFNRGIWTNDEWRASSPFVRRYRLLKGNKTVKIDEVNYWPLLFPLKCRYLLVPEHDLAGDDKEHLALCDKSESPYHAWLRPEDKAMLARKPKGGHAALLNRWLKKQIMN